VGKCARLLASAIGVAGVTFSVSASADPMDPSIERLVVGRNDPNVPPCRESTGEWVPGNECEPDHGAFKKLVSQYGFAFAPTAMHSARTTGFGGFHLSIEGAFTNISEGKEYWKRGTQGPVDPNQNQASTINGSPDTILQLYSAKLRKSFGFGLELTTVVGFMPKTSILSGGADVRLSLLEGFRSGIPGILPDIAVGGGVRTITGTPQIQLTVVGLDVQVSKPLPVADSSIITPWVGWQYVWMFADSGLVDLTPGTDAIGRCNFSGINVPGNPDPDPLKQDSNGEQIYDGQPVCHGGDSGDFNNNVVFNNARLERQRLLFGLNYRYEMVMLGAQFITDLVDPGDAQAGENASDDQELLKDEDRQWTLVFEVGAMF
jgi:hypothetical protein